MKNFIVALLLVIGVSDFAVSEASHSADINASSLHSSSISHAHESGSNDNSNGSQDCNEDDCCNHRCHFGHCSFVITDEDSSLVLRVYSHRVFFDSDFSSVYQRSLFRPPIV